MSLHSPDRRLFFAWWPDGFVRAAFSHATHEAVRRSGGRAVPAANLHMTLAFLGSVAEDRLRTLCETAGKLKIERFDLEFDRIECWPEAHVLCALPCALPRLAGEWVQNLWSALARVGIESERKLWRPHVTLARHPANPSAAGPMPLVRWEIAGFALVESKMSADGSQYTVLERWQLR